jgi:hypothetical protein
VSQNVYLLSRRGPVYRNASGFDTHRDSISSRFDCRAVSLHQRASVRMAKSVPLPPDVSDAQHEEEARRTRELVHNDTTMQELGFSHPKNG